jgi:hypothetical protein
VTRYIWHKKLYVNTQPITSFIHNKIKWGRHIQFHCYAFPTRFRRNRGAPGPVFIFCTFRLVFGGTEDIGSSFHVLRYRSRFRRYRGRGVQFSCFALSNSFWTVPKASGPIFMFFVLWLILDDTKSVGSNFRILHSITHFWRY